MLEFDESYVNQALYLIQQCELELERSLSTGEAVDLLLDARDLSPLLTGSDDAYALLEAMHTRGKMTVPALSMVSLNPLQHGYNLCIHTTGGAVVLYLPRDGTVCLLAQSLRAMADKLMQQSIGLKGSEDEHT